MVGVHPIEEHDGHLFRWTEPIALIPFAPSEVEHELTIDTGGIRKNPLDVLIAVVVGGRAMPRELLRCDDGKSITVRMPVPWASRVDDGIVLVCSPLVPARAGSLDRRFLGLPIVSITGVERPGMS